MITSGGASTRGKISYCCVLLIGFTTGSGLAWTEIQKSGISNALGKIGDWFSEIFKNEGTSSSSESQIQPFDPTIPITEAGQRIFEATQTVAGTFVVGYEWVKKSENAEFFATFLKNFLNFNFVKNVVFNFHLTVRAWWGVIFDSNALSKFPDAFKTFKVLAAALSKEEFQKNGDKEMINWLYLRFLVNPRRMLTILKRSQKVKAVTEENGLKCNGRGKGKGKKKPQGENLPLGVCFIEKVGNKLINHMSSFLKEGKIPEESAKE